MSIILASIKSEDVINDLREVAYSKAKTAYGAILHPAIDHLLERELCLAEQYGYAKTYLLFAELVNILEKEKRCWTNNTGAAASFLSYVLGISGVNPLTPHRRCSCCGTIEFDMSCDAIGQDGNGAICYKCSGDTVADGYRISLEVSQGLQGEKEPRPSLLVSKKGEELLLDYLLKGNGRILDRNTVPVAWNGYVEVVHEFNDDSCDEDSEARLALALQEMTSGAVGRHKGIALLENLSEETAFHPSKINIRNTELFAELNRLSFEEYAELFDLATIRWPQQSVEYNTTDCISAYNLLSKEIPTLRGMMEIIAVWHVGAVLMPDNRPAGFHNVFSQEDVYEKFLNQGLEKKEAYQMMFRIHRGFGIIEPPHEIRAQISNEQLEWFDKITYLPKRSWLVREAILQLQLIYYKRYFPNEWKRCLSKIDISLFPA